MMAETRAETGEIALALYEQAKRIIITGAKMHDCECEIIPAGSAVTAFSDTVLIDYVKRTAAQLPGIEIDESQSGSDGGCEDYTRMMKAVQEQGGEAVHLYVGADFRNEQEWEPQHRKMDAVVHSSRFDINEKALVSGSMVLAWLLINKSK